MRYMLQALHRNHAAPSGCYITGDPSIGYTLHFRAKDASAGEVNKMRRFTDLCNAGASVIARGAQAVTLLNQPQPSPQPAASKPYTVGPHLYSCITSPALLVSGSCMQLDWLLWSLRPFFHSCTLRPILSCQSTQFDITKMLPQSVHLQAPQG